MKFLYTKRRSSFIHSASLFDNIFTFLLNQTIYTLIFMSLLPYSTFQMNITNTSNIAIRETNNELNLSKKYLGRNFKVHLSDFLKYQIFLNRFKRRKWVKVVEKNKQNSNKETYLNESSSNISNSLLDKNKKKYSKEVIFENKGDKEKEKLRIDDTVRQNLFSDYNSTLNRKSIEIDNVTTQPNLEFNNNATNFEIENHIVNTEYAKLNFATQYELTTDNPYNQTVLAKSYSNVTTERIYSLDYEFNQGQNSSDFDSDMNTNTSSFLFLNKNIIKTVKEREQETTFASPINRFDAVSLRERLSNESLRMPLLINKADVEISKKPLSSPRPTLMQVSKSSHSRVISILGLFELTVGDIPRFDGLSELAAAKLAVSHVNQQGILPGYTLQLITNDTKCDPGVGVDRFFHALYTEQESRMVMLLGTACSEVTESIAKIVPYWNIVQVSFGSTSPALSDRNEFPLFCRTVAPDSSHNTARIAFIRQFGWDTVTAFSQNEEVYSLAVNELVTQLEAANITCAASITFAESDFKEQLLQLKELDTRIIIGSFSKEMLPRIFCEAHKLGMFGAQYAWLVAGAPNSLLLRNSNEGQPCPNTVLQQALEGLVLVDAHGGIIEDDVSLAGLTNQKFEEEMSVNGLPLSPYAAQTYDAVWAIALAIRNAEEGWKTQNNVTGYKKYGISHFDYNRKDMAEEFLYQIGNLSFIGISGPVSFNGPDRIGISAFYQIQGGQPRTVALYSRGRQVYCSDCVNPHWAGGVPIARRVLVLRVDSVWAPARLAGTALAACGVALSLAFLLFNLHYSKRRSIKLSSPRLNNMTLIGCVLVYTAVALLGVDNTILPSYVPFSAMCTCRVYILSAGFSLAFGSMFAKTYRVHRIFISNRTGVCKTKLLQDTPLIFLVCALLIIDGMIVTLWASLDPMERQLKNLTIEMSTNDRSVIYQPQIEICKSQNTTGWLCALYAYKGLLLIVGVYMAWETRNVKITALNDSKYIGISVYSVVITSISVVVIGTIISERATLAYITITSLILITTTSTLCLLFLPKIIAIRSNTEDDPVTQSLGLKLECKTRRFVTDETQELHFRIEIQNKVYRREVAALDKEIGRLERLLSEPLDSARGSTASISLKRNELETVDEEGRRRSDDHRTPSISGGLPMLLLSVLPPVIPRASWPSAEAFRGRNSVSFSSQPKLFSRKSQPSIDLYHLCLNKREENPGLLKRIKSFFGSRPNSRKASTMSIADPTGQSISAALKMHVGMIAGLVPGHRKHSMVLSCNTLNVPNIESRLRRESFASSGPIIRVTDDEPSCSSFEGIRPINKYIAEPETKVNFVLPPTHKLSHRNSSEKFKGSPRFPHRISPTSSSAAILDRRKRSTESVYNISTNTFDEQRRFSHQNVSEGSQGKAILESRWKSTEDALPGPSGT